LAVSILALAGCVLNVAVSPNPSVKIERAYDVSAALLITKTEENLVAGTSRAKFQVGKALVAGSRKTFGRMFSSVARVRTVNEFSPDSQALVIMPYFGRLNYNAWNEGVSVTIGCRICDSAGKTIYEGTATATGDPGEMNYTGFDRGRMMNEIASDAFNRVFCSLADDILAKADFSSYVKKQPTGQ